MIRRKYHNEVSEEAYKADLPPRAAEPSNDLPQAASKPADKAQGPSAPVDTIFASAVLSTTRLLAVFYWARSVGHNKPLLLLDFDVEPLSAQSWNVVRLKLDNLVVERKVRYGVAGMWVEGESLAVQAFNAGIATKHIPHYLTKVELWHTMCQSAASFLSAGDVGYTHRAAESMQQRPFLNASGVYAGPRTDDPTVAAFLFGIILGLDEVLAKDPHPKPITRMGGGRS